MMRSPLAFLMAAATALLLAALAALALAPPLLDWDGRRDDIASLLSRALGRQVALEGEISLRLVPLPALEAEAASLGADIRLEALRLEADWLALLGGGLSGGLHTGRVRARRLEARLLRRAGEPWRLPAGALALGAVEIETASLLLEDEALRLRREISLAALRIEDAAAFPGSGRVSARLDIPGLPRGGEAELDLALQAGGGVSVRISSPGAEMRLRGRREGEALRGTLEAQGAIGARQAQLRAEVDIGAGGARLDALALQWGETQWSGAGEIDVLSGRPRLELSLRAPVLDAGPSAAPDMPDILDRLDMEVSLQADSLLWRGEPLGAAAATARLDADALALDIAVEELRGGGHLRWRAQGPRQEGGLAALAGPASLEVRRPGLFAPALPEFLRRPLRLQGAFSWSPQEGRLALDADALTARLRLVRQGMALEGLRLEAAEGLRLEADGILFWSRQWEDLEGRIAARLHLSAQQAQERLAALFPGAPAGGAADERIALRGEWRFAPQAADRLDADGAMASAQLRIEAEGLARLLREGKGEAPVRASWRRPDGFAELDGALSRQEEFFRGTLRAEGGDARRLLALWPPYGAEADGAAQAERPSPFSLRAGLVAAASGEDWRLAWRDMEFSATGGDGEGLALRGEGHIAAGPETQPPRLRARLQGDRLVLADWGFLSLPEAPAAWMPQLDIAANFESVQIGALPVRQAVLRLYGDGDGGADAVFAGGRLLGGVGRVRAERNETGLPRWRLGLRRARLEQAARLLWGDAPIRGAANLSLQATGDIRRPRTLSGLGTANLADGAVCCIDIAGLRAQVLEGRPDIAAFAAPDAHRGAWTELGGGAFAAALEDGVLTLRAPGGLAQAGASVAALELDLETMQGRLRAEFAVPAGEGEAAVEYAVEGDVRRPQVSFDAVALEQALEGLRLQRVLQELESGLEGGIPEF